MSGRERARTLDNVGTPVGLEGCLGRRTKAGTGQRSRQGRFDARHLRVYLPVGTGAHIKGMLHTHIHTCISVPVSNNGQRYVLAQLGGVHQHVPHPCLLRTWVGRYV